MTQDELIEFISGLDGVQVVVASADNGAPEGSWGDVFFSVPGPGFDESSRLDRDGLFRLNIGIGRHALRDLLAEADREDPAALDPAAFDRFFPHPTYAAHGWVSVLNPETTADQVRDLVRAAHARALAKSPGREA